MPLTTKTIFPLYQEALHIPNNPVLWAALKAVYGGGPNCTWSSDSHGYPYYAYRARHGNITFMFRPPPDFAARYYPPTAMYFTPRLRYAYAGALRDAVRNMSAETADVLFILMARIAELSDPTRDIAHITLEEIAEFRGVRVRHGSARRLHDSFMDGISLLSDLNIRMTWRDYRSKGTVTFGGKFPDFLIDIIDVESRNARGKWTTFHFRCGQALSHFLNPDGLRWIGHYSRVLLRLNPYQDAFTKKIGTYWTLVGSISGKKGSHPRATPYSILDFCGERINRRNPGQTLDAFFKAHEKLLAINVLSEADLSEPLGRTKGYFKRWLETPLTVSLSDTLFQIHREKLPCRKKPAHRNGGAINPELDDMAPRTHREIVRNPVLIKNFRLMYYLRQSELAQRLRITRQTLSKYERSLRRLPESTAVRISRIWERMFHQHK